jgi:hypothetical protein
MKPKVPKPVSKFEHKKKDKIEIGTITQNIRVNVKLNLWSAIKLRIAGINNITNESLSIENKQERT